MIQIHWITQIALQILPANFLKISDFYYIYNGLSLFFILDLEIKKIAFHKSS